MYIRNLRRILSIEPNDRKWERAIAAIIYTGLITNIANLNIKGIYIAIRIGQVHRISASVVDN
ncbi:hypothetical protein [Taibaiella helva]|uniref:hypothetical protein n=1 Tax=Taibaiella helva TaxID=2301235 RepID=UPI000E5797F1|nr:hypothetical protein [Taibaiella helva]